MIIQGREIKIPALFKFLPMKKNYIYFILLFSLFVFTVLIIRYRKPDVTYELIMRQGMLTTSSEWINTKAAIEGLIYKIRANPSDIRSMTSLGMAYIQESRISGKHSYYDNASMNLFETVLKEEPQNFEALVGKATVLLSQHHFKEAIPVAELAKKTSPHSAVVYGLLTDAYVEMGNYERAIIMADKMAETRPDIRSYSRISYLREIFGDYKGSINAMKMAVDAGFPGMEQTEWCRQQLGHLYEQTGDLVSAQFYYQQSIYFRPAFSWAYAGMARVEKSKGNYLHAIKLIKQALTLLPDYSFQQELTELYRITNQPQLAAESARNTIALLGGLQGNEGEKNHGHYADMELVYAFLSSYEYMKAYNHALIEYNRRPDNIEVNQALAWVNYKLGRYEMANQYIDVALRTHSKHPVLNYKAGLIKSKLGKREDGRRLIENSLLFNPYLSLTLKWEMRELLACN